VEPLLETPEPLRWVLEGIRLMLRDAAGRVGDLLAPQIPTAKSEAGEALALYRDVVLFWLMAAHPLRARHFYGARLDMNEFRDGDFTPGRGHVGRAGGGYYLAYRKVEFKNARSQVFQSLQDHDLVTFSLDDPEHPLVTLEVEGRAIPSTACSTSTCTKSIPTWPRLRPDRSPPAPVSGCRYEAQTRVHRSHAFRLRGRRARCSSEGLALRPPFHPPRGGHGDREAHGLF
jgi:hypothetical protein